MELKRAKKAKTLTNCPIGLFITAEQKTLCIKTEYGNNQGGCKCYIVSSGEVLSCRDKTNTEEGCNKIMVYPIKLI